ncbi:uncharacterized protein [Drosophila bipectinata]|uniref:uncharacterized protein n=1 Tax=Drosophila bipectinata TaxID=42026 RepID=UPI0038B2593D
MDDYVKKGYARRLEPQEAQRFQEGKLWYLPHFGVENPNQPGKVRLVFDAAAMVNGVSLNSALMKGPQRYKPLPAVLFHFREGAVGDRCSQRFLWGNGEDQRKPDVYEMQVMTFRAACSPCLADYVKTLNASQHSSTDQRAALAIKEYHYVDDYVDSFSSEEEALAISTRVREIHDDAATEPATDDFKFGVKYHRVPRSVMTGKPVPTKREFLSLVMSTFGFLSCYMVTAKFLMREIWRRGVNWDESLPDNLAAALEYWRQGMSKIDEFRCPRYYFGGGRVRMLLLHIFVDSSQSAFPAAAYWWAIYENGDVRAHFIRSKTKCAPTGTTSSTIGHKTDGHRQAGARSSVTGWQESTEASQWRWIPSAKKVADDATRPRKAVDLSIDSRWLSGPPFLRGPEESWPRSNEEWIPPTMDEEEMKCEFALVMVNFISLQRFSNYNRLVRSTTWVLRFIRRCRGLRYGGEEHGLTSMECAEAEVALVRQS